MRPKGVLSCLTAGGVALLTACSVTQPVQVASAYTSHMICSETFVSGLDPEKTYAENIAATSGFRVLDPFLHYEVDRTKKEVTTTVGGRFQSRAVFREGLGCLVVHGELPESRIQGDAGTAASGEEPLLSSIAGPAVVEPNSRLLDAALARAFAEPARPPYRRTRAVVVVRDGRVIAERYAPGYGVDTPLLSYSMAKSVVSAFIGILVRQGRLAVAERAPVAAWGGAGDPRRAITLDQLLRHTSGLALDETTSGFDVVSRMLMLERDAGGFAEAADLEAPPGSRWRYSSGNYIVLSRIVRDAAGGNAESVTRFAHQELFGPLGMRNVTMELDATGTPLGSAFMFASARDWARFGLLYLNDGVVGGRRILPEGWVRYSTSPTPGARYGYAAGWWCNTGTTPEVEERIAWGMPRDAFFANGRLGQFIVVVPSERLVVVRLGVTQREPLGDDEGVSHLVADVIAALRLPSLK